jgi:hypothetical protein
MHTPAPWTVISSDKNDFLQIKAQPLHARGFTKRVATIEGTMTDKEAMNNAYLIKQAPVMFELLNQIQKEERITSEMHRRIADVILRVSST